MLTINDLVKTYSKDNAVGPITLSATPGMVYGLLGPNGSGKSTIIHSITDLLTPDRGEIFIDGIPHYQPEAKQRLGFVPDDMPLPYALTGKNYLDFVLQAQPEGDPDRARLLQDIVGLTDADHKFIGEYSHGMKKKLQFIAALCHHPALLILDEPFRGLDPAARSLIEALITAHCRHGGSALIATHDLLWAEGGVDQACILKEGSVAAAGSVDDLMSEARASRLEDVFLSVSGAQDSQAQQRHLIKHLYPKG